MLTGRPEAHWLDVLSLADIQVSSQDDLFPIEHAFQSAATLGWRAGAPGTQVIQVLFHKAQSLRMIQIHFIERASERTQEFVLRYAQADRIMHEVRRQQFNFSPAGSTEDREKIAVHLDAVVVLELEINPDRVNPALHSASYATLAGIWLSAVAPAS